MSDTGRNRLENCRRRPKSAEIAQHWPKSPKIGRTRPKIVRGRRTLAEIAQECPNLPKLGRNHAKDPEFDTSNWLKSARSRGKRGKQPKTRRKGRGNLYTYQGRWRRVSVRRRQFGCHLDVATLTKQVSVRRHAGRSAAVSGFHRTISAATLCGWPAHGRTCLHALPPSSVHNFHPPPEPYINAAPALA